MLDKFYKQWNRRWNKIRADVSLVLDLSSEHVPSAQQTTGHPSKCPPCPHPHPLQTTSHFQSRITTTSFICMTVTM